MRYRFGLMSAALWWGSLTALGFVVVPMLFTHMPSTAAAGQIAAKLFTAQTWLSIACAMLLLIVYNQKDALTQEIRASGYQIYSNGTTSGSAGRVRIVTTHCQRQG